MSMRWARRLFFLLMFFLFAESIAMWVRSYLLADFIHQQRVERSGKTLDWHHRMATTWQGKIALMTKHSVWALPHPELSEKEIAAIQGGFSHTELPTAISDTFGMNQPTRFGFGHQKLASTTNGVRIEGRIVVFPWAVPTLLCGIFPFIGVARFFEARRRFKRLAALNYNGMQTRKLAA